MRTMTELEVTFLSPESSREELVNALLLVNAEAKAERRRGYAGVAGERYKNLHEFVNALITMLGH